MMDMDDLFSKTKLSLDEALASPKGATNELLVARSFFDWLTERGYIKPISNTHAVYGSFVMSVDGGEIKNGYQITWST